MKNNFNMVEFDKHYELNLDRYYWCKQLQQSIKFEKRVVVKATQRTAFDVSDKEHIDKRRMWFGKVVVELISGIDQESEFEINFTEEDVVGEYKFKETPSTPLPCYYMDYPYGWNDKPNNKQYE